MTPAYGWHDHPACEWRGHYTSAAIKSKQPARTESIDVAHWNTYIRGSPTWTAPAALPVKADFSLVQTVYNVRCLSNTIFNNETAQPYSVHAGPRLKSVFSGGNENTVRHARRGRSYGVLWNDEAAIFFGRPSYWIQAASTDSSSTDSSFCIHSHS